MLKNRGSRNRASLAPIGLRAGATIDRSRTPTQGGDRCGTKPMKFTKFSKYSGEPADAIDLEELVKRLGDFFLQSGFESQFYGISEYDPQRSLEALREAILRALQEGDLFPEGLNEELRKMLERSDATNQKEIQDLIDKLIERLSEEGFINPQQPPQITPPNQ